MDSMVTLFQFLRRSRILRFLISGGTAATVHVSIVYILTEVHDTWYLQATIVGFLVALSVNFLLQKFWTFDESVKGFIHTQSIAFFLVNTANLIVNAVLMMVFVETLAVVPSVAQICSSGLIAGESFLLYRYIFRNS
jgi:putative flippase GtrA